MKVIRVLIADSSPSEADKLAQLLDSEDDISVAGMIHQGQEVLPTVERLRPDVLLMDLHMTRPSSVDVMHEVMLQRPIPILVLTYSRNAAELDNLPFRAIQAGALEIVDKSSLLYAVQNQDAAARLIRLVKLVADVHLVTRSRGRVTSPTQRNLSLLSRGERLQMVAVGASTGGPQALLEIFGDLKKDFPVPIVLVQHMGAEFIPTLVEWLNNELRLPVMLARHGEGLKPGAIAIAPGGRHLAIGRQGLMQITDDKPVNSCCPSIDVLFQSVAAAYGRSALGILLTGMGEDGARGIQSIKASGGRTVAQDEGSSIIFGMPKAAIDLHVVDAVLPLEQIGKLLVAWAGLLLGERL